MAGIGNTDLGDNGFKLKYDDYRKDLYGKNTILESITSFNFRLLESITHDAPQGVIQYESIGEDGGATKNTGRKIETLTLTGRLLNKHTIRVSPSGIVTSEVDKTYSDIRRELFELKDNGIPCTLEGHPFMNFQTRKWVITKINTGLNSGQNYLTFTISFTEYRQANIRKTTINLVNNEQLLAFKRNLVVALASQ